MKLKSERAIMEPSKGGGNEIVVYQPDGVTRVDVRFDGETVWLLQPQIAELFGCSLENVRLHLKNIYAAGELAKEATSKESLEVRQEGSRRVSRRFTYYNLDAIISIGYRVNSIVGVRFRQWATQVIKERMLAGAVLSTQLAAIDRRLLLHDKDISDLKEKVDFFVQTSQPPVQGVFYNGQVFDAKVFATKHILSAKKSILLIDNWVDVVTLEMLAKKKPGVMVEIITSPRGNHLAASDIAAFNAQYGGLSVRTSASYHDRFVIVDDKAIYLFGASLKDLGRKCFAFTKLDASEIPGLKARA